MANDQTVEHDEDHHMTAAELITHLQKFPGNSPVLILAKMPIDPDDEDNAGKTDDELDEENTLEVPIQGIEEIEYEDETAPKAIGLFIDIGDFMDAEDEEDEELVDKDD